MFLIKEGSATLGSFECPTHRCSTATAVMPRSFIDLLVRGFGHVDHICAAKITDEVPPCQQKFTADSTSRCNTTAPQRNAALLVACITLQRASQQYLASATHELGSLEQVLVT